MLIVRNLRGEHLGPVNMQIAAGETVGLAGASGSGKTLLLRAIADLDPHEGEVLLEGVDCQRFKPPEWRRQVALLFAQPQWWGELPQTHFTAQPDSQWLAELGVEMSLMERNVARLSEGERQRLALLRVIAMHPRVLLLDEPTARLDRENVERVERFVARYQQETDAAVLWVSHDEAQLSRVAERCYVMQRGCLVEAKEDGG